MHGIDPCVVAAYLRIENPLIDSPDDPFIDVARLREALGSAQARRIALKFHDHIEHTGLWQDEFAQENPSVRDYVARAPQEALDTLYFSAQPLLDDPFEIQLFKAAGFDGAICGVPKDRSLEPQYRAFSAEQELPAIAAGWPVRMQAVERAVAEPPAAKPATSTIKQVRAALARLVGEPAVRLSEGLGRLVVTTSREIRDDGYFQMSPSVLASFAAQGSFAGHDFLEKILADHRAAMKRSIESIGDIGDCAIVRDKGARDRWQMILPDVSGAGKWRTQAFDLKGFSGHRVHPDRETAIYEAASEGFTVRDDTALDRIQNSPQFQRGLYLTDLVQQINSGLISHREGDRLLAAYDETHRVLQSIAAAGAQAFVVNGGETMYLLADRIVAGTEEAVFLHEIVHRYGLRILGQEGFGALVRTVKNWSDRPAGSVEREVHDSASRRARAASGSSMSLYDEELFAYAVEEAVSRGVRPRAAAHPESAAGWLDQVAATLRGVVRASLEGEIDLSSAQDLVDLAYAFAQIESPERFEKILGVLDADERQELLRLVNRNGAPVWFSALEMRVRLQAQSKMAPGQWMGWLRAQVDSGIKPDEIHWSGVTDWLAAMPQDAVVERDMVVDFLASNGVKVTEVIKSNAPDSDAPSNALRDDLLVRLTAAGYVPDIDPVEGDFLGVIRRADSAAFLFDEVRGVFHRKDSPEDLLSQDVARLAVEYGQAMVVVDESSTESPQFESWTLSGGARYRELHLTLPVTRTEEAFKNAMFLDLVKSLHGLDRAAVLRQFEDTLDRWKSQYLSENNYKSHHWAQPNVLAHVRLTDRTDVEGRKVLFVEEIQSDWAQEGRDVGFKPTRWEIDAHATLTNDSAAETTNQAAAVVGASGVQKSLPWNALAPAPFVTNTSKWVSLAVKRIIKLAVDEGYEQVAFVNGQQSVDRYQLRREVNKLLLQRDFAGEVLLIGRFNGDRRVEILIRNDEDLTALLGAEVATRLLVAPENDYGMQELAVEPMLLGGEGMLAFYDRVLPAVVKDVLRAFSGIRVGQVNIQRPVFKYMVGQRVGCVVMRHVETGDHEVLDEYGDDFDAAMARAEALNDIHDGRVWRQPGFAVTQAMRQVARMGMPLFSFSDPQGVVFPNDDPEPLHTPSTPIESVFPRELADWFGKSCVTVDGIPAQRPGVERPLMVFRGALPGDDDVGGIDPVSGKVMEVFWATSSRMNASFFEDGEIQNLYLRLENPLVLRSTGAKTPAGVVEDALAAVRQGVASWDGVIFEDIVDGSHPSVVYAVFPQDGSVADRVRIVGRTNYSEDGDPIFTGVQPPGSDPTQFDRGDEIRHDIDWSKQISHMAARTAVAQWKSDHRYAASREHVDIDVMVRNGVIHVESIWVDPHLRGQGHASNVLRALVFAADANGCAMELELGSDEAEIGLSEWYRRLGFAWSDRTMIRMPGAHVSTQRMPVDHGEERQGKVAA
jgi:GNAT superfamily N-acetyltransferase